MVPQRNLGATFENEGESKKELVNNGCYTCFRSRVG